VKLDVSEYELISMNRRMSAQDHSLNAPLKADTEGEWQDWLVDEEPDQETVVADNEERTQRLELLAKAMEGLNERERNILTERRLSDPAKTLEELSVEYGVSRERVRQIEVRAFEKVQKSMRLAASETGLGNLNLNS
jgi:RNA polymerase sigma-32 factor